MSNGEKDVEKLRKSTVGVWRLTSFTLTLPNGETKHPMGEEPIGQHIFTATGHMSANILNPGQPNYASENPFAAADEEYAEASRRFMAWAGKWDVAELLGGLDENKHLSGTLTYEIEVVNFPNQLGKKQPRKVEFRDEGREMVVSTLEGEHGAVMKYVWQRVT